MTGFRHVGIAVSDMRRALGFYRDYLGLRVARDAGHVTGPYISALTALQNVDVEIQILETEDGCRVELLEFHSHRAGSAGRARNSDVGRSHIALTVKDLAGLYRRRDQAGVNFQTAPIASPDQVWVCFCHDPDGTLVELVEPMDPDATRA